MDTSDIDFSHLRSQGIHFLEKMIGEVWTDYNTHDPGITILEQVCYAMTDLSYRIDFELPDLLAEGGDSWVEDFFRPSEVLTTNPVTITDMRKLVMDVEGVKNAWIETVNQPRIPLYYHPGKNVLTTIEELPATQVLNLKGLYKVWVEKSDLSDIDGAKVQRDVTERLHAFRGLCEDFESIRVLPETKVRINAHIEIGLVEDAAALMVEIYAQLADYISPRIPFYTLDEMFERGKRIDEIFDGPMLEHGFIDGTELNKQQRRKELLSSDIIHVLMSIDGVLAVRQIQLEGDVGSDSWRLDLSELEATPKFDIYFSNIVLQREQIEVEVDKQAVTDLYKEHLKKSTLYNKLTPRERDILPPHGRYRNLASYYSIQHQFPQVYGIGSAGLSSSASEQRQAQARQLKAYLMFFDQLLANQFGQLAHARDLFAFKDNVDHRSYFANMIDDPELNLEPIRRENKEEHMAWLDEKVEISHQQYQKGARRNRFLNHLLARFAERFTDYSLLLQTSSTDGELESNNRLIEDKEAFLQNYPKISSARGSAFNYLKPFGSDNVSGLQERIRLKLGIRSEDDEEFYVVEHVLLRAMDGDQQQKVPFLSAVSSKDPFSLQISFLFPDWPKRFSNLGFKRLVEQTLRDETPAHLTIYTHWLDKEAMSQFETVHRDWMKKLQANWAA